MLFFKKRFIFNLIFLFILSFVYFFLRLGWSETIEFGYDQPRLSITVIKVLEEKGLLNAINYINRSVTPQVISWGPFLIYFLIPFFLLTYHPLFLSWLMVFFNFLGVIFTYLLGKKIFNQKVGIFASFFLASFPWAVVFSRMVYQPTPLLTFVPLASYLTFVTVEEEKSNWLLFFPLILSMMVQIHFLTLSLAFVFFVYLVLNLKKMEKKKLILGLIIGLFLWFPLFKDNFSLVKGFIKAPSVLRSRKKEKFYWFFIVSRWFNFIQGKDFQFQLGYGFSDFLRSLPQWFFSLQKFFSFLIVSSFVFLFLRVILKKRREEKLIFVWLLVIPFFIYFIHLPEVVPRYFLGLLPAEGLMIGLFLDKVTSFLKKVRLLFLLAIIFIIVSYNSFFITKYYEFILSYDYPQGGWFGWLSPTSDVPFSFTYEALRYALEEGKKKGFETIEFSNDLKIEKGFSYNWAQKYIWQYVLKKEFKPSSLHYFIILGPPYSFLREKGIKVRRIGPYSLFLPVKDSAN